jgi:transcriptional regulator with XRE-family HTH domain
VNLAEFLRSEMETKHLSKSELARRIGVYPDYVRRWLNGDIPQPERCKQIGDALGLSPNTIMRMAGYPVEDGVPSADPKKAADVMEMGRILDEAPEGKRPEVLAIVRAVV